MHTFSAESATVPAEHMPEVRLATPAEAQDVYRLIEEYYESVGVVVRDSREQMLQYLKAPGNAIWLAYVGGMPAGCVVLRSIANMQSAGEVKRMYVRPECRNRGIAARLMDALEEHARSTGFQWLYLDTKDDLEAAIRFYERRGFVRCQRYNDNPQATIFMRKGLLGLEG